MIVSEYFSYTTAVVQYTRPRPRLKRFPHCSLPSSYTIIEPRLIAALLLLLTTARHSSDMLTELSKQYLVSFCSGVDPSISDEWIYCLLH